VTILQKLENPLLQDYFSKCDHFATNKKILCCRITSVSVTILQQIRKAFAAGLLQ